jgi:RimJ/RimL family protein N-acetyltransferase
MRFRVEPAPQGGYRVMIDGVAAPVSHHDTEEEARERLTAYVRGIAAAEAPTAETGVARGERVALRDGSEVIVRPLRDIDKPLLLEGFGRLGERSRYQRFLGFKSRLSTKELEYLTDVDHVGHEAIGAIDPESGRGVGVARLVRERPGSPVAEAAVAVVDAWQGRGLGWALLERLAARAHEVGVTEFTASLLVDNRAMLALFARLGRIEVRHDSGSTTVVHVALPAQAEQLREALRSAARRDVTS